MKFFQYTHENFGLCDIHIVPIAQTIPLNITLFGLNIEYKNLIITRVTINLLVWLWGVLI